MLKSRIAIYYCEMYDEQNNNFSTGEITVVQTESIVNDGSGHKKGLLLALLSIPVAIIGWLLFWQIGVIASIVPFASAWLAVWLYTKGSSGAPLRSAAVPLLIIILAGVVLAFMSGMMADAWAAYREFDLGSAFDGEFLSFFIGNLGYADLWAEYTTDIAFSLVFAALGAGGIIKSLFTPEATEATEKKDA